MSSTALFALCMLITSFFVQQSRAQVSILAPNDEERALCEKNRNGRTLVDCKKDRRLSCHVVANYHDEETGEDFKETFNSPNGQQCCDLVGGMPTGCCKDGKCPPGDVKNCKKEDE